MSDDNESYTWNDWLANYATEADRAAERMRREAENDVYEFKLTRWGMPDFLKGIRLEAAPMTRQEIEAMAERMVHK